MKFSDVELPSNKKFGLFFGVIFTIAVIYSLNKGGKEAALFFAILAFAFINLAFFKPELLLPINKLWMRFGLLLGMFFSPLVLGLMFFILFTPIGFSMRLFGRDELRLRMKKAETYWQIREISGPSPESFRLQF